MHARARAHTLKYEIYISTATIASWTCPSIMLQINCMSYCLCTNTLRHEEDKHRLLPCLFLWFSQPQSLLYGSISKIISLLCNVKEWIVQKHGQTGPKLSHMRNPRHVTLMTTVPVSYPRNCVNNSKRYKMCNVHYVQMLKVLVPALVQMYGRRADVWNI